MELVTLLVQEGCKAVDHLRKNPWSCGQPEREADEFVYPTLMAKPEVQIVIGMERNVQVGIGEIERYRPVVRPYGLGDRPGSLHLEMRYYKVVVQSTEVDHWTPFWGFVGVG